MSDPDTIDVSHVKFSSTAMPSEEDIALWESLSDAEKIAVLDRELAEAEASGIAQPETMAHRIERVRKSMTG
ncbi:MAG: hypothetical protein AAF996_15845 [Pseudomonadota bacterium]